jgi:hypothetical protein
MHCLKMYAQKDLDKGEMEPNKEEIIIKLQEIYQL